MIQTVAEIASTNTALLARLGEGMACGEGNWLVADRPPAPTLALVAGVAVHRTGAGLAPNLRELWLKWPNDLLLGGAKLAGILLERQGDAVVVGIGVNLAAAPTLTDREATSLRESGVSVERDAFAEALAAQWTSVLGGWHGGDWPALREEWLARGHPLDTSLMMRDAQGGPIRGRFAGLEPHGAALLRLADGTTRAIHAGEIEMVGSDAARD